MQAYQKDALLQAAQNVESSLQEGSAPSQGSAEALPAPRAQRRVLQLHGLRSLQLLDDLPGAYLHQLQPHHSIVCGMTD